MMGAVRKRLGPRRKESRAVGEGTASLLDPIEAEFFCAAKDPIGVNRGTTPKGCLLAAIDRQQINSFCGLLQSFFYLTRRAPRRKRLDRFFVLLPLSCVRPIRGFLRCAKLY